MITYELCLLFRLMPKTELVSSLKRTANAIYDKGGILRKLENLGTRDTPHKISAHGMVHRKASCFVYEINVPPTKLEDLNEELGRDVDIVRRHIFKKNTFDEVKECTLHEEMLPVPYRKDVQDLLEQARKLDKPKFVYGNNLDHYPFQK
ncbi:probable 28S ribosomal protein S6, mitochondrial [Coccinella septempunctata]|uniref:probable 28S ribosomal protein S6, mitochondrial n=1 Tax=Coccinella septempunctata TaxID=41139 RepID=UPI001D06B87F|nr:probable 28S ribosomal protein S6, mitochondrial [Coccinella septempunctata]XP_044766751.1 probable 28S ribosomal protein S6, mitochondrial [Coccinella septempunctata]